MLLDQLLQGGTGGAEQAPSGGSTAVPALVGDAATGQDASGFSEALGLLTAAGEETPDGASIASDELIAPDLALLLAPSEGDEGVETPVTPGVLEAATAAAGTAVPVVSPETGVEVPAETGDEAAASRSPITGVPSGSTVVAAGASLDAGAPDAGGEPVAVGGRAPSATTHVPGPIPEQGGAITNEARAATQTIPADPFPADAGSPASPKPTLSEAPAGQADAAPTRTTTSPAGGGAAPVSVEQQTAADGSARGVDAAPPRTPSLTPPPAETDSSRPAPVAPEGSSATPVASERAATLVAAASRPAPRQASGNVTPVTADSEPSPAGNTPPTAARADVLVAQSDGTGLVAGIGEETPTTGAQRTVAHAAIVSAGETLARATGQRPPAQRSAATTTIASTGSAETGSTPSTQSAPAASQTSPTGVLARVDQPQGFSALAERIVDALHLSAVRGGSEIRLRVEPHGLGHIDVRVQLQDDGVRAMIVAEHEATRALISSNQHLLEAALGRSELRLSGFSVDLGLDQGGMDFHETEQGSEQDPASGSSEHDAPEREGTADQDLQQASVATGRLSLRV